MISKEGLEGILRTVKTLITEPDSKDGTVISPLILDLYAHVQVPFEEIVGHDDAAFHYFVRGGCKTKFGRHEEAIHDFDKAIELDSQNSYAYNLRGFSKAELGKHEEAIHDFDKAIELDEPQDTYAYHNRGLSKAKLGRHEEAIHDFDKFIELDPQESLSLRRRGELFEKLGQTEKAIADYQTALKIWEPRENRMLGLIAAAEGLTRLGLDHTAKVEEYKALAKERGWKI